tara:strand:- start:2163 stop:3116 length:954 start_codon:yes stop_codon:yes gene_type:complete
VDKNSKIFVAGHRGLVGSAIIRLLSSLGYNKIITKTRHELDLRKQSDTKKFFEKKRPEYVIIAAAKVGGIFANSSFPAHFLHDNLLIQNNLVHYSYKYNVSKLLFLGSACIYPKYAVQPIKESELLNGKLEPTNEWYAIAKIAGIKLCQSYFYQYKKNFISIMPNNLYGPNDNFDLKTSHVLPALLRKFHEAKLNSKKRVSIWGTGKPLREFLHVDDLADAMVFVLKNIDSNDIYDLNISHINIGSGEEISIKDLARMISKVVGFNGQLDFDISKPDGTPRKLLDNSFLFGKGWYPKITLNQGIKSLYMWYRRNIGD